jgi:hypothetical protein
MSDAADAAVTWKSEPDEHDYPAAASYLALVAGPSQVAELVKRLQNAPLQHFKAKDVLRAARLPLLPVDNMHVVAPQP